MELLRLKGISKSFPDGSDYQKMVLKCINLRVDYGEFIAIRGESGSGKTTLLSILGTLIKPDEGSYLMDGEEMIISTGDHTYARNHAIGFVFQDHRLLPQYTVLENILLPTLANANEVKKTDQKYAQELMAMTNIPHVAKKYPATLSGGEACRVAVCRALIRKPDLLLADEPTGQLDQKNAQNIAKLFLDVCDQLETSIVMVTHSDEMASCAYRQLTLKEGRLQ